MRIPVTELEVNYARSSGPGGQNVNKVNSKCMIHWNVMQSQSISLGVKLRFLEQFSTRISKEGFLVLSSDRFRDQKRNFEDCFEKLNELVKSVLLPPKPRKKTKPSKSAKRKRLDSKRMHSDKKASRQKY